MKLEDFLNNEVHTICGGARRTVGNKFGLELELEGAGVWMNDVPTRGWTRHKEGSLRGDGVEYVFTSPKDLEASKKAVIELFQKFEQYQVKLHNSVRTSTHVHLNFSDKKVKAALNFYALFTVVEELLTYYSGEDRTGNLFCISSRDAEGLLRILKNDLSFPRLDSFMGDRYKYAACNLCTLFKFNTIEVRTMRGADTAEQVNDWLDILNDLYEYSLKMTSPAELPNLLSMWGAGPFLSRIFSEKNKAALLATFPKVRDLHDSLMEGARLIQLFAYEHDEAFKIDKVIDKAAVKAGGKLPLAMPNGEAILVYRPDGVSWGCFNANRAARFWRDGDRCQDDARIVWDEAEGRFYMQYPEGKQYLRWARHPELGNEGRPVPVRALPRNRFVEFLEEMDEMEVPE